MNAFNFFDKIYYINLDNREDRNIHTMSELSFLENEKINRFSAIVYNGEVKKNKWHLYKNMNKYAGCSLSHYKIIEEAKKNHLSNVLVFEDDISFITKSFLDLENAISELPRQWDLLYLGIGIDSPNYRVDYSKYSEHLVTIKNSTGAFAVCYNNNIFDYILDKRNQDGYTVQECPADKLLAHDVQLRGNSFLVWYPIVSTKIVGNSCICGNERIEGTDNWKGISNGYIFLDKILKGEIC